jgi:hypothetical protein
MIRRWLPLLLIVLPLDALAQDGIHRCIGPDGNPLFTDQPCAALNATPVTTSAAQVQPPQGDLASTVTTPTPVSCAATLADLRQSMLQAFAARNPNRLAGLMLWNGYGRDAVVSDIRSLGSLMQRPLLDIGEAGDDSNGLSHGADSDNPSATPVTTDAPPVPRSGNGQLVVRTAAADGSGASRETRFDVVRRSGCLWLRGSG